MFSVFLIKYAVLVRIRKKNVDLIIKTGQTNNERIRSIEVTERTIYISRRDWEYVKAYICMYCGFCASSSCPKCVLFQMETKETPLAVAVNELH